MRGRYVSPGRKSPVENRYLLPASGIYPIVLGDELVLVGGTSAVAPAWPGAIAQLNQVLDRRVGLLARVLPPRPGAAKRSLQRSQTGRVSSPASPSTACRPCATPPPAPGSSSACWPSTSWWFSARDHGPWRDPQAAQSLSVRDHPHAALPLSGTVPIPSAFSRNFGH